MYSHCRKVDLCELYGSLLPFGTAKSQKWEIEEVFHTSLKKHNTTKELRFCLLACSAYDDHISSRA